MVTPYYDRNGITLYLGDCREVLPELGPVDLVFTDPPWLNLTDGMNTDNPMELFREASRLMFPAINRAVVILGCDTDPRMLSDIDLPFWNTLWVKRTPVFFKGSKFIGADVCYVFGDFESPSGRGARVYNQEFNMVSQGKRENAHPCPRNQKTIKDILSVYGHAGETILDPFLGSGTSSHAAQDLGMKFVGIEINEDYLKIAIERLRQEVLL